MAQPPLLTLTDITLGFGGKPLFEGLSLAVHGGERICLVGRNGSGKSTLMKIMAGQVEPDEGVRFLRPGVTVAYMDQDPDFSGYATLGDYAAEGLDEAELYRAEMALEGVKLDGARDPASASGGERRRAALARLIATDPDLMLIDEPTNHLDIDVIDWLEGYLRDTRKAFVLISHDRAFLRALTRQTLWVDRGEVRRLDAGFSAFEDWRDKIYEEEDAQRHKLDRLIKAEGRWAVEGISARRKRNQGRVRRLADLRETRGEQIARSGPARMELSGGAKSGRIVVDATGISKTFDGRVILEPFDLRIQRGERVALIGPNGAGKTTLLNMLTGQLDPDTGQVRLGTNLDMAVFDQNRTAIAEDVTLWDALTLDPGLGVSGRSDQIMVRGMPKHVVGYLKEFLFTEAQARSPVGALSGGERARLLLARIMARQSNFLVLDEPTNDLDIETLDLLQELIDDYDGTVLLVSHDRDFIDRVATTTIAMEGNGRAVIYAGGYSDYRAQAGDKPGASDGMTRAQPKPAPKSAPRPKKTPALSFTQQHRLGVLPDEIARLEAEIAKLQALLADPGLFETSPARFRKAGEVLADRQGKLAAAEEEWMALEELREKAG